jgi:hypothetical protein
MLAKSPKRFAVGIVKAIKSAPLQWSVKLGLWMICMVKSQSQKRLKQGSFTYEL